MALQRVPYYKTGNFKSSLYYVAVFFVFPVILQLFDVKYFGFILGAIVAGGLYLIDRNTNPGSLELYLDYCLRPSTLYGNVYEEDDEVNH